MAMIQLKYHLNDHFVLLVASDRTRFILFAKEGKITKKAAFIVDYAHGDY